MPSIFAISDTWFNRLLVDDPNENVVNNNEHIIQAWNEAVKKDDIVYILGGFGIGDLYHILVRLNGEIHFLNNYFNDDEIMFMTDMKGSLEKSSDLEIKKRIIFETNQIIVLKEQDTVLSYIPLMEWPGKPTGTYCFHGLDTLMDLSEHNITCVSKYWNYTPVDISKIKSNVTTFESRV